MSKCKFIDNCTHATGWCNSERTWKSCEYINDICGVTHLSCSYCNPVCSHRIINRKDDILTEMEQIYRCEYCGTPHDNPVAKANCVLTCYQKKAAEEEKAKWDKMVAERESRIEQIKCKRKELSDLEKVFYDDYGELPYSLDTFIKPFTLIVSGSDKDEYKKYVEDVLNKFRCTYI